VKRTWVGVSVIVVAAALTGPAGADPLVNGGFETGDFTGWTLTNGYAPSVEPFHQGYSLPYYPMEGTYFAVLKLTLMQIDGLSQYVDLQAGDTLTGWVAADAAHTSFYRVSMDGRSYEAIPFQNAIWDFGTLPISAPWQSWSWTAPAAGTYRVYCYVRRFTVLCG